MKPDIIFNGKIKLKNLVLIHLPESGRVIVNDGGLELEPYCEVVVINKMLPPKHSTRPSIKPDAPAHGNPSWSVVAILGIMLAIWSLVYFLGR